MKITRIKTLAVAARAVVGCVEEAEAERHPFQQEAIAGLEAMFSRDGSIANW